MENTYFSDVFVQNRSYLDKKMAENDMKTITSKMLNENKDIGAILLECTNMPPYKNALKEVTDLPIFDIVSLCDYVINTFGTINVKE